MRPSTSLRILIPLVCVLLAAAIPHFAGLARMKTMLNYDEAYYAADALSLISAPRFEPFFPDNYGRESGWIVVLAIWMKVFGVHPLASRLAAMLVGWLTLAAVYALAREVIGRRGALWSSAALAVLYWHIQVSHLALRANTFPLIGALALAALLRANRRNHLSGWIMAGCLIGLLAYTYFSARLWIGVAGLLLGWWFVWWPDRRPGTALAAGLSLLLAIPLIVYSLAHPAEAFGRITEVGVFTPDKVLENVRLWGEAWLARTGQDAGLGLPGRPILDPPLAALTLAGMAGLWMLSRSRWLMGGIIALFLLSITPSLFSEYAPHLLRAIGATIPLSIALGAGAAWIEQMLQRFKRLALWLPAALIVWAGADTLRDINAWIDLPIQYQTMEQHSHIGAEWVQAHIPAGQVVYFSPFDTGHPVVKFNRGRLADDTVMAFNGSVCTSMQAQPATYVSATFADPALFQTLSQWGEVKVMAEDTLTPPRHRIYQATAGEALLSGWDRAATFGEAIQARLLAPLPSKMLPGDLVVFTLAFHPVARVNIPYQIFAHVYGDPTPYAGGRMWAAVDQQLCEYHTTQVWSPGEYLVQTLWLTLPADISAGQYQIAIGLYDLQNGQRLPVSGGEAADYLVVHSFSVP